LSISGAVYNRGDSLPSARWPNRPNGSFQPPVPYVAPID